MVYQSHFLQKELKDFESPYAKKLSKSWLKLPPNLGSVINHAPKEGIVRFLNERGQEHCKGKYFAQKFQFFPPH